MNKMFINTLLLVSMIKLNLVFLVNYHVMMSAGLTLSLMDWLAFHTTSIIIAINIYRICEILWEKKLNASS
jgi:hypothetical protein